jgi:hypothetical protein
VLAVIHPQVIEAVDDLGSSTPEIAVFLRAHGTPAVPFEDERYETLLAPVEPVGAHQVDVRYVELAVVDQRPAGASLGVLDVAAFGTGLATFRGAMSI